MLKRFASMSLAIYVLLVFASSVKAKPLSCSEYAVTNSEKQLVEVLQDMNAVKSEIVAIEKQLKDLRSQMDSGYDSTSDESVNKYDLLVNDFNSLVSQVNQLKDEHNSLRDSFNSLVNITSPSRNTGFVLCMNSEVMATNAATVKLNVDSLK